MTKRNGGKLRGHKTYRIDKGHNIFSREREYFYTDDDSPVDFDNNRDCIKCGLAPTEEGHDPCIANLPGVDFACCGHGNVFHAYVKLTDRPFQSIRGQEALDKMEKLKNEYEDTGLSAETLAAIDIVLGRDKDNE